MGCKIWLTVDSGCVCGALRVVYSIPFMNSLDKSYNVSSFALSGMGEMAAGFLVLCVPSIPKLVKNTTTLQKMFGRLQLWIDSSSDRQTKNSRMGLPSWIRVQGERQAARHGTEDTTYSEPDEHIPTIAPTPHKLSHSTINEKNDSIRGDGSNSSAEFITMQQV